MTIPFSSVVLTTLAFAVLGSTDACSCGPQKDLCGYMEDADVMVKAEVISSYKGSGYYDPMTYNVKVLDVFKTDYTANNWKEIEFTTAGSSAACGIELDVNEWYLLDLKYSNGEFRAVGSCGGWRKWRSVSHDDEDVLHNGCKDKDPCNGWCGQNQECLVHRSITGERPYCADTCDNHHHCKHGEECELVKDTHCTEGPCPSVAWCKEKNPCDDLKCHHHHKVCKAYTNGYGKDKAHCIDACEENPCDDKDKVCTNTPDDSCKNEDLCPHIAVCKNPCGEDFTCGDYEVCKVHKAGHRKGKAYCTDECEPDACGDDEVCSLQPAVGCTDQACKKAPNCEKVCKNFRCPRNEVCEVFTNGHGKRKPHCRHLCDVNPCDDNQVCNTEQVNSLCTLNEKCKMKVECTACTDNLSDDCGINEVCRVGKTGYRTGMAYCAPVCEEDTCDGNEACTPVPVKSCTRDRAWCQKEPSCADACEAFEDNCKEDEVCEVREYDGQKGRPHCVSPCHPNPCAGDEVCSFDKKDADCVGSSCEKEQMCKRPCDGFHCSGNKECRVHGYGDWKGKAYCAPVCYPSMCGTYEECKMEPYTGECAGPDCPPETPYCAPKNGDPCHHHECNTRQVCQVHPGGPWEGKPYCTDVCNPSPCDDDEECEMTENVHCYGDQCSPKTAVCKPKPKPEPKHPCDGHTCDKFQECAVYTWGYWKGEPYCADVCHPKRCGRKEVCELKPKKCDEGPCAPMEATCTRTRKKDSGKDRCDGKCGDFQECVKSNKKWTCSDTCEKGACGYGKKCKLKSSKKCRKGKNGKKECPKKRKCY